MHLYIHTKQYYNYQSIHAEMIKWTQIGKSFYYVELPDVVDVLNSDYLDIISKEIIDYVTSKNDDYKREEVEWMGLLDIENAKLEYYQKISVDLRFINFLFPK